MKMRWTVRGVVAPLILLALTGLLIWSYASLLPKPSARPGVSSPPQATIAQSAAARVDSHWRRQLADEVVQGTKSFEQAGCEYRHGDWDRVRQACNR